MQNIGNQKKLESSYQIDKHSKLITQRVQNEI
jgi:hypothetical protein